MGRQRAVAFGTPWVYDYAGAPYKTDADRAPSCSTSVYADTPGGEPGNDDLGAMSSWYVWSSLGMYPETPGTPVLALGAPIFSRARLDAPRRPPGDDDGAGRLDDHLCARPVASTASLGADLAVRSLIAERAQRVNRAADRPQPSPCRRTADPSGAPPRPTRRRRTRPGRSQFPPGRKPTILIPTGPTCSAARPPASWTGRGRCRTASARCPAPSRRSTTPAGRSAVHWTETDAGANTWIWANPPPELTGGQTYQATITLQGTGVVYVDFWNGQEDLTTATVQLTSTPVTLTLDGEVPGGCSTPLQVRTADAGPVDLFASSASIQLLTPEPSG